MAETKNADDLVYEVAGLLGKVIAGEPLQPVEYQTIDDKIDGVLGRIRPIVFIGDRDEIPIELFDNIALIVAQFAGAKFANANPDLVAVKTLEADLRYLVSSRPTYAPLRSEYY